MKKFLKIIYRKLPFGGKYLMHVYLLLKNIVKKININKVKTKEINGIKYELHLNELIDSEIYYYGFFEKYTTIAISKLVKPGMTALDIGANIGCHTLQMAKIVGQGGVVIAFEPMKWPRRKLLRNIELNNINNIVIEDIGLSDSNCVKEIQFQTSWRIDNSIDNEANKLQLIKFLTLDEYIQKSNINRVDFIKIDVDGYEYKILVGAKKILINYKPIIVLEIGDYTLKIYGDSLMELILYVKSLGYNIYYEHDFKKFKNNEEILDSFPNLANTTINVILCHESKSCFIP